MTTPGDFDSLLANLGDEPEDPTLPFRWEDVPHEFVGLAGYRTRADASAWRLSLDSGRTIHLTFLKQGGTYAGVLAGSPRSDPLFNDRVVKNAIGYAASDLRCAATEIAVLAPRLLRTAEAKQPDGQEPGSAAIDYLPPIRTLARFESSPVADKDADWSSLVVLWFQDTYGLPEAGHVTEQLRALDWDRLAEDQSW
jgi:hypothetical protein